MKEMFDKRGNREELIEYSPTGRVIRKVHADGGEFRYAYQLIGAACRAGGDTLVPCTSDPPTDNLPVAFIGSVSAATLTDPRGNSTTYRFNGQRYITEIADALGQKASFNLANGTNLVESVEGVCRTCSSGAGDKTSYEYDANGNDVKITDALGNVTRFEYEPNFNQVTKITDALGNVTRFEYDAKGNLLRTFDPLNNKTERTYDSFGQLLIIRDANGSTVSFDYNEAGDPIATTDTLGNTTMSTYDSIGNLLTKTDPTGSTEQFIYDANNRHLAHIDSSDSITRFTYDADGNLLTVTDANGNTQAIYTYDARNRRDSRTDSLGKKEIYRYDTNDNLVEFTDRRGLTARFTYNELNRLKLESYKDSTLERQFDAEGRLVLAKDSIGGNISFTYDALGRVRSTTQPYGTISYDYDDIERRRTMSVLGREPVIYEYQAHRLKTIKRGGIFINFDYEPNGNLSQIARSNGVVTDYTYDLANRLVDIVHSKANTVLNSHHYDYDARGNRIVYTTDAAVPLSEQEQTSTYNNANQLLTSNNRMFGYDDNGNVISVQAPDNTQVRYTYDARNRFVQTDLPSNASVVYHYDAMGRRIQRSGANGTKRYVYSDYDTVSELDGNSNLQSDFIHRSGIDDPLALTMGAQSFFYGGGGLGHIAHLTDTTGQIVQTYSYGPFGTVSQQSGSLPNPYTYTSREYDSETELFYYRARMYSAVIGRFLQPDLIEFNGKDVNLYRYVANDPINYSDPIGLIRVPCAVKCGLFAVAAAGTCKLVKKPVCNRVCVTIGIGAGGINPVGGIIAYLICRKVCETVFDNYVCDAGGVILAWLCIESCCKP